MLAVAVIGGLAAARCENDQRAGLRGSTEARPRSTRPHEAVRALHPCGEGIVAASVEQHEAQFFRAMHGGINAVARTAGRMTSTRRAPASMSTPASA